MWVSYMKTVSYLAGTLLSVPVSPHTDAVDPKAAGHTDLLHDALHLVRVLLPGLTQHGVGTPCPGCAIG